MAQAQGLACAACGGEFATDEALAEHARLAHKTAYRCGCGEELPTQEALREHARREHAAA